MDTIILALEALYTQYQSWFTAFEITGTFFISLMLVELVWDYFRKTGRRFAETAANIMVAVGGVFTDNFVSGFALVVTYAFIQPFALFQFEMTPLLWVAAIVLADFLYYWMHRAEHEIRIFWAYHVSHHSSPEFDLTTAYRLSWVEGLFEWIFVVPMLLLGFDALATFIALIAVAEYQTWIHTQKIDKMGILDKIINTPSAHRVHHGSNPKYLDKNYGGIFLVWDHLFGTYQAEEETVVFGITEPIKSINPFVINFHEYGAIIKDCWQANSWAERWKYIFAHPGWKPADTSATNTAADKAA